MPRRVARHDVGEKRERAAEREERSSRAARHNPGDHDGEREQSADRDSEGFHLTMVGARRRMRYRCNGEDGFTWPWFSPSTRASAEARSWACTGFFRISRTPALEASSEITEPT